MEVLSYNQNVSLPKNPGQLQQNLHHSSMVNLLQGMTSLARYADSLFTSIANDTHQTFQRIDKLSHRVEQAQQESAIAHESILKLTLSKMLENYKAKFAVERVVPKLIADPSNRPFKVQEAYRKANPLPKLEKLQQLTEDGKNPARMFSDPSFFYEDWHQQEKRRQEVRRENRKKKYLERSETLRKKPAAIKKDRWDPVTGARVFITEAECTAQVEILIPLPSSDVVILDEEFGRPPAMSSPPAVAPLPAVSTHRVVVTPTQRTQPQPQPGENRNDLEVPLPATFLPDPVPFFPPARPYEQPSAVYQPPAAAATIPVPPPLPTAARTRPAPPADPRAALLDAIRQAPTCVLRRPPAAIAPNPASRNNGDKSLLVNLVRDRIDAIRDAMWSSGEDEPESEGSTSDWD